MASNRLSGASQILLLLAVILSPLTFGAVEPWSQATLQALTFTTVILSIATPCSPTGTLLQRPILLAAVGTIALGVVQWLNPLPVWGPQGFLPFSASRFATANALMLWTTYVAILWLAPRVLGSREVIRRFAWAIFALGIGITVLVIFQENGGGTAIYGIREVPNGFFPFGPFYNRNHAASLLAVAACIGMGLSVGAFKAEEDQGTGAAIALRVLTLFFVGVVLFGVYRTRSRAGMVAVTVALVAGAIALLSSLANRRARILLSVALCAGVAMAAAWFFHSDRSLRFHGVELTRGTAFRLSIYKSGLSLVRDFPLFGTGLGTVRAAISPYKDRAVLDRLEIDHIHSDWLEIFLQLGCAGGVIWAVAALVFSYRAIRRWALISSFHERAIAAGMLAGILAFALHSVLEFGFQTPANAVILFSLIGALERFSRPRGEQSEKARPPFPLRMGLTGICVLFIASSARTMVAEAYAYRSRASGSPALFDRAHAWDPNPEYTYRAAALEIKTSTPASGFTPSKRTTERVYSLIAEDPVDPKFRRIAAAFLSNTSRRSDADGLVEDRTR